ncbi:hypothetical protein RJ640_005146 [Escallonia rubra]|uniref:Uncharacterized protein n=1 Tax=Escallonia rubra TaxID=112253 RepID=A0AA88UWD3_9ASTE|nr:hypothetical protein RJ640_005146 [Escallonia rubra]
MEEDRGLRNRKELIKAAVDSRYALVLAHVKYFQSLSSVGNALQNFVEESVVASVDSTTITGSDHGALNEGSELGTSSWDSETDVISLTDYVHEGSESSEPSSLTVESRLEGSLCIDHCKKCSEEVSTRVFKQSQVVSGPKSVTSQPHHENSGQSVNLPLNAQYGYDPLSSHWSSQGGIGVSYGASVNMRPSSLTSDQYDYGMSFSDPVNLPSKLPRFLQHGSGIFPGGPLNLAPNSPWCMRFPTDFLPNGPRFPLYENGVSYSFPMKLPANDPYFNQAFKPRAAPPCPPPPEVSTWDSLNPFRYFDDNFLGYYYQECCGTGFGSANGPDFKEVNESEGIPDLEDEIEQNLMEEASDETVLGIIDKEGSGEGPSKVAQKDAMKSRHEGCMSSEKDNVSSVNDTLENEMKRNKDSFASKGLVEDKKKNLGTCKIREGLALDGASLRRPRQVTATTLPHGSRSFREALEEIKDAFETVFNHGKELSIALEAGKLPYQLTVPPIVISSPWKHVTPKRLASRRAKMSKISSVILERDTMNSGNLTSTLDKLCAWEKKLYKEVKINLPHLSSNILLSSIFKRITLNRESRFKSNSTYYQFQFHKTTTNSAPHTPRPPRPWATTAPTASHSIPTTITIVATITIPTSSANTRTAVQIPSPYHLRSDDH